MKKSYEEMFKDVVVGIIFVLTVFAILFFWQLYEPEVKSPQPDMTVCEVGWYAERRLGFDWWLGTDEEHARMKAGHRMIYQGEHCTFEKQNL